jgi:peptide deformylase
VKIVHYPHPTLRHISKPLKRVDKELHGYVREMFDLMYEARGIGLAANQVDLPYRLFVINLESDPDQPEQEHVFLNPVITSRKGMAEGEEGCLSIPGLYANVKRPERVTLNAYNMAGEELNLELDGLFARAVQHEIDHLDGVLFIDRLSPTTEMDVREALLDFEDQFVSQRERGEIPDDSAIAQRLSELEQLRA